MANIVGKIDDKYFVWSTIVDLPIQWNLDKESMREFLREEALRSIDMQIDQDFERVEKNGTSLRSKESGKDILTLMQDWLDEHYPNGTDA